MSNPSWFKATLSGLIGAAIGVVFVAVANLVSPAANLVQLLVVVCVPAFLSAIVGNLIGARQRKAS
jgi:H+/Cl- antiporter ClcA